jgi:hypothetical protein
MTARTFHIVCNDCTAENLIEETERFVRELKQMHEARNPDHRVEYAEMEVEQ